MGKGLGEHPRTSPCTWACECLYTEPAENRMDHDIKYSNGGACLCVHLSCWRKKQKQKHYPEVTSQKSHTRACEWAYICTKISQEPRYSSLSGLNLLSAGARHLNEEVWDDQSKPYVIITLREHNQNMPSWALPKSLTHLARTKWIVTLSCMFNNISYRMISFII